MSFLRSVLALALWGLAILTVAPPAAKLYSVVHETAIVLRTSESVPVGATLAEIIAKADGVAPWLIFSALCVGNAMLLHILSAIKRL